MQKHSPSSCCSGVMALPGWEGARAAGRAESTRPAMSRRRWWGGACLKAHLRGPVGRGGGRWRPATMGGAKLRRWQEGWGATQPGLGDWLWIQRKRVASSLGGKEMTGLEFRGARASELVIPGGGQGGQKMLRRFVGASCVQGGSRVHTELTRGRAGSRGPHGLAAGL